MNAGKPEPLALIRLRAHHLLCLLTYVGRGYNSHFVANLSAVAARLSAGEGVVLVEGPDDICAPLLGDEHAHCRFASVTRRDRMVLRQLARRQPNGLSIGTQLTFDAAWLAAMRQDFASGAVRQACQGCTWYDFCSDVAETVFCGARLRAAQAH